MDMTLCSSHVHKDRAVTNNYYKNALLPLSGWSKSQIKQRFESTLALMKQMDHRIYAQILLAKSDSAHRVVNNSVCVCGQHRASVRDLSASKLMVVNTDVTV